LNLQEILLVGNKAWSILFGVAMAGCAIGMGVSPFVGWWMPEGVSTHAANHFGLAAFMTGILLRKPWWTLWLLLT